MPRKDGDYPQGWIDVNRDEVPKDVPLIARTAGELLFCVVWNGSYYVNHNTGLKTDNGGCGLGRGHKITHVCVVPMYRKECE